MRGALALAALLIAGCGGPVENPGVRYIDASPDATRVDASSDTSCCVRADVATDVPTVNQPFALAAGEVVEVPVVNGVASVRLASTAGTEGFIVVLASTSFEPGSMPVDYRAEALSSGAFPLPSLVRDCSLDDTRWGAMTPTVDPSPTGAAPPVGATRDFRVPGATAIVDITARVVAVSEHAVVWLDVTPGRAATVDDAFVTELLRTFEGTILPREHAVFGTETDVDGDGRISLVISPVTAQSGDAFFWRCDLQAADGCGVSNHMEAVYLAPLDLIPAPYNTITALEEIVSHELAHLIHFGRKVLRNSLPAWPDSGFMIEGFGHFAQDAIGFQADNLYTTDLALQHVDEFSMGDLLNDGTEYMASRDRSMRGGAYLFVRWLYDRAGGDSPAADGTIASRGGPALVHALLDASTSVAASLHPLTGARSEDLAMDFYTTLAASNREEAGGATAVNTCFRYGAVVDDPVTHHARGADLFARFDAVSSAGPATQALAAADGHLLLGGVEFLTLDASAGQSEVGATIHVDPSAAARVRVVRVR